MKSGNEAKGLEPGNEAGEWSLATKINKLSMW